MGLKLQASGRDRTATAFKSSQCQFRTGFVLDSLLSGIRVKGSTNSLSCPHGAGGVSVGAPECVGRTAVEAPLAWRL
jgi:hypothetical protein